MIGTHVSVPAGLVATVCVALNQSAKSLEQHAGGVTDEVVEQAIDALNGWAKQHDSPSLCVGSVRAALQSVWPVSAEPAQADVIGTLDPLVRELETIDVPGVVLQQITLLGKFAAAARKLISEAMNARSAQPADSGRAVAWTDSDKSRAFEWLRAVATADDAPDEAGIALDTWHALATAAALAAQGQGEAVSYFAADPAEGEFNTHESLVAAVADAKKMLDQVKDAANYEGWPDEPPQICYGVVLGRCVEKEGSRRPAPEGSDFTGLVDYRLTEPREIAASPAGVPDVTLQSHVMRAAVAHGGLRQLSRYLGIDAGYLSRLANGEKTEPGEEILAKLGLEKRVVYLSKQAAFMRACEQESQPNG